MKRREFIKQSSLLTGGLSLTHIFKQFDLLANPTPMPGESEEKPGVIPKRRYGKSGPMLSILGLGGIVVSGIEQEQANRIVAEAYERGINYYDVAPTYGDAEIKLGPALEPCRKDVFLSCKTVRRDYASGKAEFEQSLERLKTDYLDLYQLHAITDIEKDVNAAFAADGVMKLLTEEKKQGRVRYLGFSAHSPQAALEALGRYDFDSVMFPVNFAESLEGNFSTEVLEYTRKHNIAVLALKVLARQRAPQEDPIRKEYPKCWYQPITDPLEARLAMAFTFSQPVTSAIPPGDERLFKMALDLVCEMKPITEEQIETLKALAATLDPIFQKS